MSPFVSSPHVHVLYAFTHRVSQAGLEINQFDMTLIIANIHLKIKHKLNNSKIIFKT